MKKSNISIPFDDEKLKATRYYADKKEISIEDELEECLQKIYEKHVPKDTREYIELTNSVLPVKPKPRSLLTKTPTAPAVPHISPVVSTANASSSKPNGAP